MNFFGFSRIYTNEHAYTIGSLSIPLGVKEVNNVYRVTLSTRGQVSIPSDLRKNLQLKPGTRFNVYHSGRKIILVPQLNDPIGEGLGFLNKKETEFERGKNNG